MARTLSEAIKRQILLNKDFDLSYFLHAAEADIQENNAYFTCDLNSYQTSANITTPNSVYDVLKGVVPFISTAISTVYSATRS